MHRIFGKAKPQGPPEPKPDLGAHIQKMSGRVPEIDKKIQDIDVQLLGIKKQLATARTPSQKNYLRQQAMQLLKRKKMYEAQRGNIQQTTFNLDMVQFNMDNIQAAQETAKVMKSAAGDLKAAQQAIDLDEIEDLQEDMIDLLYDAEELNEIMSRDFSVGVDINEMDLNAELDNLDAELDGLDDIVIPDADVETSAVPAASETQNREQEALPDYLMPLPPSAQPLGPESSRVANM